MPNQYFRTDEAAEFIRENANIPCAPSYLRKKRVIGGGPSFRYVSRFPVYEREDLLAYIASRTTGKRSSTSGTRSEICPPIDEDLGDLPDTPRSPRWMKTGHREFDDITRLNEQGYDIEDGLARF